ncbi:carbohydrate ABC transporter substrate-binding protein, CUT1 family [Saccharopolyspora kobensis]|uniref:Carbohydrate ABC transporter substrate-binding protein, CUT1 family n=1 Tax=Saccharopolyspora kobensis TaxID=146035 RepID=A0A1H5XP21_9PSEU|nr:sugar ABC transporter substrate-binding protein [Saccharopolyspora kobensis]SEG13498.1 carbohydrate ABC transporter substrate-binding protein, CUT1 family [Saccharopolyspora kobensis]SFE39869.1 carbohydrate ABC transporter substrate-binding protein, CUT1 family [Saccharopolyspora kobensis]
MDKRSLAAVSLIATLITAMLTGCAPPAENSHRITYWASNQGKSSEQDLRILGAELAKFTERTGIEVDVEVIGWSDLLNRILGAATSGVAPDVVNLGNTWAASLQATGAFVPFDDPLMDRFGGRDRFLDSSMSSTGMPGRAPSSLPLYGLSYGLFYDKARFAEAGIDPPRDWQEFLVAAKRLTDPARDRWGLTIAGASYTENAHFAFMFGRQQGTHLIDERGNATFTSPEAVAAVRQYVDLMGAEGVVSPDDAEEGNASGAASNFTNGRAAMLIAQNSVIPTLQENGMPDEAYGVVPLPVPDPLPPGGRAVRSHVAGSNVAVFADSPRREQALALVEFLTSAEEQAILNDQYGTLPVVEDAYGHPAFHTPKNQVFREVLATGSETVPMIPNEAHFETTVGAAMRDLFAEIATGRQVGAAEVREALSDAEQKMRGSGG